MFARGRSSYWSNFRSDDSSGIDDSENEVEKEHFVLVFALLLFDIVVVG